MRTGVSYFTARGSQLRTTPLCYPTRARKSWKSTPAGPDQDPGGSTLACPNTATTNITKRSTRLRPDCRFPIAGTSCRITNGGLSRRITSSPRHRTRPVLLVRAGPKSRSPPRRACVATGSCGRIRTAPAIWRTRSRSGRS